VALASYLVVQPDILLLDEPFAGLDPRTHAEMAQFMVELQQEGKTIVLSTHNMRDLVQITPHAMVLRKGEKVFEGATTQLFSRTDLPSWDLMAPLDLRLMTAMRKQGWNIPVEIQQWSSFNAGLQNAMKGGENALL
jgi:energy-coupling factor transport system ATP-binding protein